MSRFLRAAALRRWALACALAMAAGCGPRGDTREPPLEASLHPARLLADVAFLASDELAGRRTGTSGAAAARAYLLERFRELRLEPAYDGYLQPFRYEHEGRVTEGVNAVAKVDGTDQALAESWIVVSAHYDHLGVVDGVIHNGADDNASGVAAMLGIAAALAERPLRRPVLFAALDAEESDLQGALALVREPPVPLERLALDVNLDMLGRSDGGALWAAGTSLHPWLREPLERAAAHGGVELRFGHDTAGQPEDWTLESDHAAFHVEGIPFVYFGVEDHRDYHRPTDDIERIDEDFLAGSAALVLRALRELDAVLPLREGAGAQLIRSLDAGAAARDPHGQAVAGNPPSRSLP